MIWTGVRPYRRYLSFRLRGGVARIATVAFTSADKVGAVLHNFTDDGLDSSAEGRRIAGKSTRKDDRCPGPNTDLLSMSSPESLVAALPAGCTLEYPKRGLTTDQSVVGLARRLRRSTADIAAWARSDRSRSPTSGLSRKRNGL